MAIHYGKLEGKVKVDTLFEKAIKLVVLLE